MELELQIVMLVEKWERERESEREKSAFLKIDHRSLFSHAAKAVFFSPEIIDLCSLCFPWNLLSFQISNLCFLRFSLVVLLVPIVFFPLILLFLKLTIFFYYCVWLIYLYFYFFSFFLSLFCFVLSVYFSLCYSA